ncbi:hypothetical protein [Halobellus limi]|jgi:hypothetical protein|nr:hypothetical protein [Halobellus limi]
MPGSGTSDGGEQQEESGRFSITRRTALTGVGGVAIGSGLGSMLGRSPGETTAEAAEDEQQTTPGEGSAALAMEAGIDEVLPGDKFGKVRIGQYAHSLQVSGTRRPAWLVQPFHEDVSTTSTSYEETGSNIGYGLIPFPPGQVPILRTVTHIENNSGSTASLRISIANREMYVNPTKGPVPLEEDPVKQTILEVTGKGSTQVYDEAYLSDHEDIVMGMPNGSPNPVNSFIIEVKTDDPNQAATIKNTTTVSLELEAL